MVEGSIEDNGKRAVCCLGGIIQFDMRAPNGTENLTRPNMKTQTLIYLAQGAGQCQT